MASVYELEQKLETLAEELEPHLELIPKFLSNLDSTNKPLSLFSTFSFFPKIESIRLGIYELVQKPEIYSSKILFRSLIEHFVKFQYLWIKTMRQSGDEIGIDFWVLGRDQEKVDYARALYESYQLVGIKPKKSPHEVLKEMGIVSSTKTARSIRKKADQFLYKNMVKFISKELKFKEKGDAPLFGSMFPKYSELSTFVHGGPESVWLDEEDEESIQEIVNMSTFASLYARNMVDVAMYQHDKSVEPLLNLSAKYLHEFAKT